MGLFTDHLHEEIEEISKMIVKAAKGEITSEFLSRWIFTFHPEHCKDMPLHLQHPLTESEMRLQLHVRS